MNQLLSSQLWHLFEYAELTEAVTQNDHTFVNVLNNVHLQTVNENTEELLKAGFTDQSDKNYTYDALNMYAENTTRVLRNQTVLNKLPSTIYSIKANGKTQYDCRYLFFVIQGTQNLKKKISNKVMLTVNIDNQDHPFNGPVREVAYVLYVKFSNLKAGLKTMTTSHFSKQHSCVRTEKTETEIPIKKEVH